MRIAVAGGTGAVGALTVRAAEDRGHDVVVLSRARGVDLVTGEWLDLSGVDAVIDASGPRAFTARRSRSFFAAATGNLLRAGAAAGVRHHLALSIVGAARAPHGYYAGKALQERLVADGAVPWTVLRSTQFFEFGEQNAVSLGPWRLIPRMRSQPIAASAVAVRLIELAEGPPLLAALDLAGPEQLSMADVLRAVYEARGERRRVIEFAMPGSFGRALRDGSLLPEAGAGPLLPGIQAGAGAACEVRGPRVGEWSATRGT